MNLVQTMSPDTAAIVALLTAASVGATVTYEQMSHAIGRPIGDRRYLLPAAIRIAARDHGAIFGTVRKIGYQRLPATDAHILGAHTRRRIRSSAKRAAEAIVSAVERANDLPDGAKRMAYAEVNSMSLIRHLATDKQVSAAPSEAKAEPIAIVMRRFALAIGAVE
jgi:hypothetical protein